MWYLVLAYLNWKYELTSPFKKQYIRAMKKPWNEVKKCVVYDQSANSKADFSSGASYMWSKFVIPNSGKRKTAARTAFLWLTQLLNYQYWILENYRFYNNYGHMYKIYSLQKDKRNTHLANFIDNLCLRV